MCILLLLATYNIWWRMKEKNLTTISLNTTARIKRLDTQNKDLEHFLFTLGCYPGEDITLVSIVSATYIIVVKDARYSIDKDFARAIIVE